MYTNYNPLMVVNGLLSAILIVISDQVLNKSNQLNKTSHQFI